jgi:hypothetical protein
MCRNIKTLHNFRPPATDEEIRASALQFVRKLSGFARPSKANQPAFDRAVQQVAEAAHELPALATSKRQKPAPGLWNDSARPTRDMRARSSIAFASYCIVIPAKAGIQRHGKSVCPGPLPGRPVLRADPGIARGVTNIFQRRRDAGGAH